MYREVSLEEKDGSEFTDHKNRVFGSDAEIIY